jgi:hypothetical protein
VFIVLKCPLMHQEMSDGQNGFSSKLYGYSSGLGSMLWSGEDFESTEQIINMESWGQVGFPGDIWGKLGN